MYLIDFKINLKENGFIFEDSFYSYSAVTCITPITYIKDDNDIKFKLAIGDSLETARAYKQTYFKVYLNGMKPVYIGYMYYIDFYEKIPRKNKIMKFLFGDFKYIKNRKMNEFYRYEDDRMKNDFENLKNVRNQLILKINELKEKNENF